MVGHLRDAALRTLLLDEMNALQRMVEHAQSGQPLTVVEIQVWQREATRHQEERLVEIDEGTLTRMRVPMVPGQFKQHENRHNPQGIRPPAMAGW